MPYQEVPVVAAKEISERFSKEVVVIVAWDQASNFIHTTTYGSEARFKQPAAELGVLLAKAAGSDVSKAVNFEDFRHRTESEWAAEREKLINVITGILSVPEAVKALANWGDQQLIAARNAVAGRQA